MKLLLLDDWPFLIEQSPKGGEIRSSGMDVVSALARKIKVVEHSEDVQSSRPCVISGKEKRQGAAACM